MRKALKITTYIIGSIVIILLCGVLFLNTPWGQNFVRSRAEAFLNSKLKTTVRIGRLGYGLPKFIVLEDVFIADRSKDTLLAVGRLKIDLNMLKLLDHKVDILQLSLERTYANIYRNRPDTNYNFTYIINTFMGGTPPDSTLNESPGAMKISVKKVKLNDIRIHFDDKTGGMMFNTRLNYLYLSMKKIDLERMAFHIKDLQTEGIEATYAQDSSWLSPKSKDTGKVKFNLAADNLTIKRTHIQYNDALNHLLLALDLGSMNIKLNSFILQNNKIDLQKLDINNSSITFAMGDSTETPAIIDTIVKKDTTEGWDLFAGNFTLNNVNFKLNDRSKYPLPYGIDYNHLDVKNIYFSLSELRYNTDAISANIAHLSMQERSGLWVQEFKTRFAYDQHGVTLNNLYAHTPNTILQDHIGIRCSSLENITREIPATQLDIRLKKSIIGFKDIMLFAPWLRTEEIFKKYPNGHLNIDTRLTGTVGNMNISQFEAAGMDNTEIILNGKVIGLPDVNRISYNLNIDKFKSSRNDILNLMPDTLISPIRLPDRFALTGNLSGTTSDYYSNLHLISTDGQAYIKGSLLTSGGKGRESYNLQVKTGALNIGRILKKDSVIGMVTASADIKGKSFDFKTMSADFHGSITSAIVKGYNYNSVNLNGHVHNEVGTFNINVKDPNIQIRAEAQADFHNPYPAVIANIRMDSIDFHALKLYDNELRVAGTIQINFPELNPDYPKGKFAWHQAVLTANGRRYFPDSIYITSNPSTDSGQNIVAELNILQATIRGKTPLTKIGAIIQDHVSRHYFFGNRGIDTNITITERTNFLRNTANLPPDYYLQFTTHIADKPLLRSILPGLKSFDSIRANGSISPQNLKLNIEAPQITYNTITIEGASAKINEVDSAFRYELSVNRISQGNLSMWYTRINGKIDQNRITTNISTADKTGKEQFAMAGYVQNKDKNLAIHLQPGLVLDYNTWQVSEDNEIVIADGGFYVNNLELNNNSQSIKANSIAQRPNVPLHINISNFLLANFTNIFSKKDTLLANGILNGSITLQTQSPSPQINANLSLRDLSLLNDTLGNLQITADNKTSNTITAAITLTGKENDIAAKGSYYTIPQNGNDFNFDLDIKSLSPRSFESIAGNNINNSSGHIRGNLHLKGTFSHPQLDGALRTDNLSLTITQLNNTFKMPSEEINFSGSKISLDNFNIYDTANNKALITGSVDLSTLTNPDLNLKINATNWQVIHSTDKVNKMFYGDLVISTNLTIKGAPSAPFVDGNLRILKGTDLTVVNPESTPQIEQTKGIVVFINRRDSGRHNILKPRKKDSTGVWQIAGSDINVNITIDKNAQFSLLIDQASGDFLRVKGDATLNAAETKGGTLTLTGVYNLHEGAYQLNYNFIKRRFVIKDGSTITFAGDPLKGTNINLTAAYEAMLPPYDLIQRQVPDPTQLTYFKQRVPFNVELHLQGPVLSPAITFDILVPEGKISRLSADQMSLVEAKLNQIRTDTAELNKQVFAVLILNHFVAEDPFNSGATNAVGLTARQSVATFIGEQLNQVADKLFKGIDVTADLQTAEDYTTGEMRQRTDLSLAASKNLLNDRLKITVGNNFELEGPQTTNSTNNGYIPSNLAADYLLSGDGRYTVRIYRRAYDEGVLRGYVTETGTNFIVNVDYNRFKTIFRKTKKMRPKSN